MTTKTAQFTPGPLHNVTGHRPGPWIRQVLNDESEAYVHDKHCNAIARVYSLSDAALIAAAPAMYEALETVPLPKHNEAIGEFYTRFYTWYEGQVKQALAQVEGKHD